MDHASSSSYLHLFWGYAAIWLCLSLAVFNAVREQRKRLRELESLRAQLRELQVRAGEAPSLKQHVAES
jgi:hypothetical protein